MSDPIVPNIDYFPLRIRVYRNGDMFDNGRVLAVTRKQFKHWIVFLDALTALLQTSTAIRKLFTTQGVPVNHFDELDQHGEYVAVENGQFINVPYGNSRYTMRGKRYNPIIKVPDIVPTFLNSAESMDIYLKKEGYGTITANKNSSGLPYPFDGILTRSPSASQLHFKHLQSHQIPPLKIGGSMEHLNEIPTVPSAVGAGGGAAEATTTTTTTTTTTAWLGNNEKWLMGERVKDDEGSAEVPVAPASTVTNEETVNGGGRDETSTSSDATNLKNEEKTKQRVSKLPRPEKTKKKFSGPTRSEFRGAATELFPPIKTTTTTTRTTMTSTSDDLIQNIDETQTISDTITSSKVSSRKPPPPPPSQQPSAPSAPSVPTGPSASLQKSNEDEVTTWHQRSFHVTETLSSFKAPQPAPTPAPPILKTKMSDEEKKKLKKEVKIRRFDDDVDINPIAKRKIDPPSRIVSSRSAHLFVDEVAKEDIDDVIARAQLWEKHKKQQKMRQRQTQTSSSINRSSGSVLRSLSAPRHSNRFQFFDPDFD